MMIELNHGDRVRLATWAHPYDLTTVEVHTVRGYVAEYREDPEEAFTRARERGHETAWTIYVGSSLTDSRAFNEAKLAEQKADLARAVILSIGDVVTIEGETFEVRVPTGNLRRPRNSGPIHFALQH